MIHKEECRTYRGTPRDILSDFQNRLSRKIRFRLKRKYSLGKFQKFHISEENFTYRDRCKSRQAMK